MLSQEKNTKILPNEAPIIVTWTPRETGATLPDGENSKLNYVDILIQHKQKNNEKRKVILFVNGPGFKPDQIEELKDKFKGIEGIHIVDLHDPKYDRYWKEIDKGWKINGKPISIKEYYRDMYSMKDEDRTHLAIEADTFRYIAALFVLLEQKELQKDLGVIYTDFDALGLINSSEYKERFRGELYTNKKGTEQKGIGQNITIPYRILIDYRDRYNMDTESQSQMNNDVFAITDYNILQKFLDSYKRFILNQPQILELLSDKINPVTFSVDILNTLIKTPQGMRKFLRGINSGQAAFINKVVDMKENIGNYSTSCFNFGQNGGEYLPQCYTSNSFDPSWLKEHYIKEKDEQAPST
ncbi:MAG: hypothetical protein PG981_001122 [Wolbachia endosymbiont of Ctenocephalides orientis wCori]|nr:MAG: hypothetical protein PG981_001122 [Wolbachia endosymbiont of Ctenocephalides orientis wCori]